MLRLRCAAFSMLLILALPTASIAQIDTLLAQGETRTNEGAAAQRRVDSLADQTADLVNDYRTEVKLVDGLKLYNTQLQRQIDAQLNEMDVLRRSTAQVAVLERQVYPLMIRMVDTLEQFIEADVPFLMTERRGRVSRLRDLMDRSDVTAAEKLRRVLESYSIETEFGRTLETYAGEVPLVSGQPPVQVEFLRLGRVALLFQSSDGETTGMWDTRSGNWATLPPETYKSAVSQGLRIASGGMAPNLIVTPVPGAQGAGQ